MLMPPSTAAAQSEPARLPIPTRTMGGRLLRLLDLLVVAAVVYGLGTIAWGHRGAARIYDLQAVGAPDRPDPAVWVTLKFKHRPAAGDLQDVRVIITSPALQRPAAIDWHYIAAYAHVMSRNGITRTPAPLPVSAGPPLGKPIDVKVPLSIVPRLVIPSLRDGLPITAEIHWAGEKQDETTTRADELYLWTPIQAP